MKVGILTHYDVNNQGAQLQLYALYTLLTDLGHEPVVLTYKKNYDFVPELELRNQISLRSVPYILKHYLLAKGLSLTAHNVRKYIRNKRFRKQHFRFDSYCSADIDAAIVGADEVFSLELGPNMMMYGHGVNTDRMIAYAPSFGQTDMGRIEKFHCKELIGAGLKRFRHLSARDENTRRIITELTNRDALIVCDPVLLYRFPLESYSLPSGTPRQPYIVVYSYDARFIAHHEIQAVKQYAKRHGLKTVSVGTFHKWCDVNIACDALQWLKCIQGAQAVITDTFHGTIAAAITNCPMVISYSSTVNSSKMLDLISRLGLDERLMEKVSFDAVERILSTPMNMEDLNRRIETFRHASLNYLIQTLQE